MPFSEIRTTPTLLKTQSDKKRKLKIFLFRIDTFLSLGLTNKERIVKRGEKRDIDI